MLKFICIGVGICVIGLAAIFLRSVLSEEPKEIRVRIFDEATSPMSPVLSVDDIENVQYRAFVSNVLDGIEKKFGHYVIEADPSAEAGFNELSLVRIPLVASGDATTSYDIDGSVVPAAGCVVNSPWAKLVVDNAPHRRLRGVIFWNERQIVQDQAALATMTEDDPAAPAEALRRSDFERFAQDYADIAILKASPNVGATSLGERIPPGLLWLFYQAPQSTRGPFSMAANSTMRKVAERAVDPYAALVTIFMDRCQGSGSVSQHYESVLDVRDLVSFHVNDTKKVR